MNPVADDVDARQRGIWASGDYSKIAWLTVPIADALCDAVDLRPGASVLDVATGTGHVALAAARRFCPATGVDFTPALVEIARRRAEAEGLAADFRVADAQALPFADDTFDVVVSALGVMFAADQQLAADEVARVCRRGGRIGLANWTPTGFVGELLRVVGRYAPPPPGSLPATRWGTADAVRDLFGSQVTDLTVSTTSITQRFESPQHFADFFLTYYGPTLKAAQRLDPEPRAALRDDLVALAVAANRAVDGTVVSDWEYALVTATAAQSAGRRG